MWPAFPTSDYYGSSAPPWQYRSATDLPLGRLMVGRDRDHQNGSHVHYKPARWWRCPAIPLRHRHIYAAVLRRGLPAGGTFRSEEFPALHAGARRNPAQIYQIRAGPMRLRGFMTLVPHVHLPISLAGPAPSGSPGTSRRCRGCCPPDRHVPVGPAAPSFIDLLRQVEGGDLSSPHGFVAPRGAQCHLMTL